MKGNLNDVRAYIEKRCTRLEQEEEHRDFKGYNPFKRQIGVWCANEKAAARVFKMLFLALKDCGDVGKISHGLKQIVFKDGSIVTVFVVKNNIGLRLTDSFVLDDVDELSVIDIVSCCTHTGRKSVYRLDVENEDSMLKSFSDRINWFNGVFIKEDVFMMIDSNDCDEYKPGHKYFALNVFNNKGEIKEKNFYLRIPYCDKCAHSGDDALCQKCAVFKTSKMASYYEPKQE